MAEFSVEFVPYSDLVSSAESFLINNKANESIPVPIEEIVEFSLGIDIIPVPNLQRDFDVEGFTSSDLSSIWVDEFVYSDRPNRYRFTLAHEVGHIILHGHIFKQFKFDSISSWKTFVSQIDPGEYSTLEYQGYAFAGLILVPPVHLKNEVERNMEKVVPYINLAKQKRINRDSYLSYAKERIASYLAPIFEVSTSVIIKRIEKDRMDNYIP